MVVAIAVVAMLLLGGSMLAAWVLTTDDGADSAAQGGTTTNEQAEDATSSANEPAAPDRSAASEDASGDEASLAAAANEYVDAVNNSNEAAATALTCDKTSPGTMYDALAGQASAVVGDVLVSDGAGTVYITVQGSSGRSIPTPFLYRDGSWCISI